VQILSVLACAGPVFKRGREGVVRRELVKLLINTFPQSLSKCQVSHDHLLDSEFGGCPTWSDQQSENSQLITKNLDVLAI